VNHDKTDQALISGQIQQVQLDSLVRWLWRIVWVLQA